MPRFYCRNSESGLTMKPAESFTVSIAGMQKVPVPIRQTLADGGYDAGLASIDEGPVKLLDKDAENGIYRSMINCMSDGFAVGEIMADEQGAPFDCRFLEANPAFERITGCKKSELIRLTGKDVFSDFNPGWVERIAAVKTNGPPVHFTSISPGTGKRLEVQVFKPRTGLIAVMITDIAMLMRTENEKREQQESLEQLHHAQKMDAIGRFAGSLAHDFNNILTTIIGGGQLLLNKLPQESPLRQYVEIVLSSGQKAVQLTESLRTFSGKRDIELKPMDMNKSVSGAAKLLSQLTGEDIELRLDLCEVPLVINGNDVQIVQVLTNLATNSRDAMPHGGLILIKTERLRLDQEFMNVDGWGEPGDYAVISFSDTGAGIREMHRGKVFEPFFTTKDKGKGTGLGLSIVHGIIRQHGGYIRLDSTLDQKTTFVIYLPLTTAENSAGGTADQAVPTGRSETVLLAEDDPTVRLLEKTILEGNGYRVIEAYNGHDAVDKFEKQMKEIDIVILDVVMPGKNGGIVYQEIQEMCPGVKVLFISGYTADLISQKGIEDKSVNFISKPLTPQALLQKVREVLEKP